MSKAYGLPGLRVGWAVADPELVADIWTRHEYTTISATMLSNHLAALALSSQVRPQLLQRTRDYIRRGYPVLERWMAQRPDLLTARAPDAAAIAFCRYDAPVDSLELANAIRTRERVLVVPGAHFGIERHLRISFGLPEEYLTEGLERIARVIESY